MKIFNFILCKLHNIPSHPTRLLNVSMARKQNTSKWNECCEKLCRNSEQTDCYRAERESNTEKERKIFIFCFILFPFDCSAESACVRFFIEIDNKNKIEVGYETISLFFSLRLDTRHKVTALCRAMGESET